MTTQAIDLQGRYGPLATDKKSGNRHPPGASFACFTRAGVPPEIGAGDFRRVFLRTVKGLQKGMAIFFQKLTGRRGVRR
jgi:hypothetical protein